MSRTASLRVVLGVLALLVLPASAPAVLIGVVPNGSDSNFVQIDSATGAATIIGPTGFQNLQGLAVSADFTIYAASGQLSPVDLGTVITINPETGTGTEIGPTAANANGPLRSLTFHGGVLYAACNQATSGADIADSLCAVNEGTGEITFGPIFRYPGSSTLRGVDGLEYDSGGVLFGVANPPGLPSGPGLFRFTAAGGGILVGTVRDAGNVKLPASVRGLTFVGSTLYATTSDGRLLTIDKSTGIYTVIGSHGISGSVSGLADFNLPPTPTPTATNTLVPTPTETNTPTPPPCTLPGATNPCIPSGGVKVSECYMEWLVTPVPTRKPSGIPFSRLICREGDPDCDVDPDIGNNSCTFRTGLCINNSDPRFPTCSPLDLVTFEVLSPNPNKLVNVDPDNLAVLENQAGAGGFGVTVVRKGVVQQSGTSNNTPNLCGGNMDLKVPLRLTNMGARKRAKVFRVRGTTSLARKDIDPLRLECRPSTCGNLIQEPWEQCDDGNRMNGDGCNQGCKVEVAATPTNTAVNTSTATVTRTPTETAVPTATNTSAGPVDTATNTAVPTATHTATPVDTNTPSAPNLCGNGVPDAGELCDDGGACFGGTNQGNPCTSDGDCTGGGDCRAVGGDGCASNCTPETSVFFQFTGAKCFGGPTNGQECLFNSVCAGGSLPGRPCSITSECGGGVCQSECGASSRGCFGDGECTAGTVPLGSPCPMKADQTPQDVCQSGADQGLPCSTSADCAGGAPCGNACGTGGGCANRSRAALVGLTIPIEVGPLVGQQELRLGQPDANGFVPVVAPAASTVFAPVKVPGLVCACVRGAEDVGVHGPGNTASGVIACGAQPIANNATLSIDHNTSPPNVCLGGATPGMACTPRCAAGGSRAGLPCITLGSNSPDCPGTGSQRTCRDVECGIGVICNIGNGPGVCGGGSSNGRACFNSTQCASPGVCVGHCLTGNVGASCSCSVAGDRACDNSSQCGAGGYCRVTGNGGGFCMGPPKYCVGGTSAGRACYNASDCTGGGTCPGAGNFLGFCDSDSDCPGSICNSLDDPTCVATDPAPPSGSGDVACLEERVVCTQGPNLGNPCTADNGCGANGKCGTVCTATPSHVGVCNSPTHFQFSGNGGPGSALFVATIQIGTIGGDGGTCQFAAQCAGGSKNGLACFVNGDCPGGACASAICNGICSGGSQAGNGCLSSSTCGGGTCIPGATFNVPCTGSNPTTECGANAICRPVNLAKGFDGIPCSDDDPPASQGEPSTIPQTNGTSLSLVVDANNLSGQQIAQRNCVNGNPDCVTALTGTPFNCASLLSASPSTTGVRLVTVFPTIDGVVGDSAITTLLTSK